MTIVIGAHNSSRQSLRLALGLGIAVGRAWIRFVELTIPEIQYDIQVFMTDSSWIELSTIMSAC